jgi:hypothetical protein
MELVQVVGGGEGHMSHSVGWSHVTSLVTCHSSARGALDDDDPTDRRFECVTVVRVVPGVTPTTGS